MKIIILLFSLLLFGCCGVFPLHTNEEYEAKSKMDWEITKSVWDNCNTRIKYLIDNKECK